VCHKVRMMLPITGLASSDGLMQMSGFLETNASVKQTLSSAEAELRPGHSDKRLWVSKQKAKRTR